MLKVEKSIFFWYNNFKGSGKMDSRELIKHILGNSEAYLEDYSKKEKYPHRAPWYKSGWEYYWEPRKYKRPVVRSADESSADFGVHYWAWLLVWKIQGWNSLRGMVK